MKKFGFTLAEILVALAIVGVVAAISIPTMVTESNKKIWANSLAVAVSNFENALTTYVLTEGETSLLDTEKWQKPIMPFINDLSDKRIEFTLGAPSVNAYYGKKGIQALNPKIKENKTLAIITRVGGSALRPVYESKNGVAYSIIVQENKYNKKYYSEDTKISYDVGRLMIDVNGQKGPNRCGRDIFFFLIDESGYIYPFGGNEYIEYRKSLGILGFVVTTIQDILENCDPNKKNQYGEYCAARVVENGFKMDY